MCISDDPGQRDLYALEQDTELWKIPEATLRNPKSKKEDNDAYLPKVSTQTRLGSNGTMCVRQPTMRKRVF